MGYEHRVPKLWEEVGKKTYEYGGDIAGNGMDLNNYFTGEKNITYYRVGSSTTASNGINFPTNRGGVTSYNYWTSYASQKYINFDGEEFVRFRTENNNYTKWGKYFTTNNSPLTRTSKGTGWCKLANGLILQWGDLIVEQDKVGQQINLPITYSQPFRIFSNCTPTHADAVNVTFNGGMGLSAAVNKSIPLVEGQSTVGQVVHWFTIGY